MESCKIAKRIAPFLIAAVTTGCMDGGGESTPPVTYRGKTTQAALTGDNAWSFVKSLLYGRAPGTNPDHVSPYLAVDQGREPTLSWVYGPINRIQPMGRLIRSVVSAPGRERPAAAKPADEIINCPFGGTLRKQSDLADSGYGRTDTEFRDCRLEPGIGLSGRASMVTNEEGAWDIQVTFDDLWIRGAEQFTNPFDGSTVTRSYQEYAISGSANVGWDCDAVGAVMDMDYLVVDAVSGHQYRTDVTVSVPDDCTGGRSDTFTGRIHHSDYGYVDISTIEPLQKISGTTWVSALGNGEAYNLHYVSGTLRLTGADGSNASFRMFTAASTNDPRVQTGYYEISVDADADGTFESSATMPAGSALFGGAADIRDSDGDGMPNSWEEHYGLDPADPADGIEDRNGDGVSNRDEYYAQSHPVTAGP